MRLLLSVLTTIFFISFLTIAEADPPISSRIGGTVTVDGTQLLQSNDTGYTFAVTQLDGTSYEPAAEDTDGLNETDWYVIDIPIYDPDVQPGGANPDDTAVIHVYEDGSELEVISPEDGETTVGEGLSLTQIDLVVSTSSMDSDGDGILDVVDNCPDTPNPNQEDSDEDGVGDACECRSDFDSDGDVDVSDLAIFAADLGRINCTSGPPCEGDFDSDGDVDDSDLGVFAADFARTDCH
jgi:hypothetical protein